MKLSLGENIKELRKEKGLTQEELAEIIGVAHQSVSRWERGECYPDIELLPVIADFLDTTTDKILGVGKPCEESAVKKYLDDFQVSISRGDIFGCIDTARKGLEEFPNNFVLLNKLMYALFVAGDEDGNIPSWKENMEKYDEEITLLGERIMKYCPDLNIRLEAAGRLAFNHCEMGRREIGRRIYMELPSLVYSREAQTELCALGEDERLDFIRNKMEKGFDVMTSAFFQLTRGGFLSDKDTAAAYEKMSLLREIIYDGKFPECTWETANENCSAAAVYIRLGQTEKALERLRRAAECAGAFDSRPEEEEVTSLLLGSVKFRRRDFETADSRPLSEIMRDKWLMARDFDLVRELEEFKEIEERLRL